MPFDALAPLGGSDFLLRWGVAIPFPRPDFLAIACGHLPGPRPRRDKTHRTARCRRATPEGHGSLPRPLPPAPALRERREAHSLPLTPRPVPVLLNVWPLSRPLSLFAVLVAWVGVPRSAPPTLQCKRNITLVLVY